MTAEEALLDIDSPAAKERWASIALEARQRRLAIEIRDGSIDLPFRVAGKERSSVDWNGGSFATLDQAFRAAETWVRDHDVPGPNVLRDELKAHGRKLAVLTPRELGRKGSDFPLYRRFRDRILPLAFDNLVDSVRLEAIETAVRELLAASAVAHGKKGAGILEAGDVGEAIGKLRGLVPEEARDD